MGVYDVNGDGLNDVVTSLEAHGWGLAWYEQKRDKSGAISFTEHIITDDYRRRIRATSRFPKRTPRRSPMSTATAFRISSWENGSTRTWRATPIPTRWARRVLYWFRTVRNPKAPGGAEFKPELIHNRSGVGSTVLAVDLNKDGAMDIVTSTNRGTFIFWGKPGARPRAAK